MLHRQHREPLLRPASGKPFFVRPSGSGKEAASARRRIAGSEGRLRSSPAAWSIRLARPETAEASRRPEAVETASAAALGYGGPHARTSTRFFRKARLYFRVRVYRLCTCMIGSGDFTGPFRRRPFPSSFFRFFFPPPCGFRRRFPPDGFRPSSFFRRRFRVIGGFCFFRREKPAFPRRRAIPSFRRRLREEA